MLKTRVIPCMLFNGLHLVKTTQFAQPRTLGNPVQFARVYNSRNVDELIFIDILASAEQREPAFDLIAEVFKECFMPLTVGGGIRTMAHVDRLMKIGADKIIINSEAIHNPAFITAVAQKYGSQCVVVAIDVKKENDKYYVFDGRGKRNTQQSLERWAQTVEARGAGELFINAIDRDGMMTGYDIELIENVSTAVSVPVIACGGAGSPGHVVEAVIRGRADAVSLASLFHYTEYTPQRVKEALAAAGVPVRV